MRMRKKFFYQQLYRRYVGILFSTVSIIVLGFAFYFLNAPATFEKQNNTQALLQNIEQQKLINRLQQSINYLLYVNGHEYITETHQRINDDLKKLNTFLPFQNTQDFPYLEKDFDSQKIIRIATNNKNYQQTTMQVNAVIAQALTELNKELLLKNKRSKKLAITLETENINDQVNAYRMQSFLRLTQEIKQYSYAIEQLNLLSLNTQQLNLQIAESHVEKLASHAVSFFDWFSSQQANIEKNNPSLFTHLRDLEDILVIKEAMISKWRVHIQAYHQYQNLLIKQQEHLQTLQRTSELPRNKKWSDDEKLAHILPNDILSFIQQNNIQLTVAHLNIALLCLLTFMILLFFLCITGIHRLSKQNSQNQIAYIENFLLAIDEKSRPNIQTAEQAIITELLFKTLNVENQQTDPSAFIQQQKTLVSLINQQPSMAYVQLNKTFDNSFAKSLLTSLLGDKFKPTFRHNFTSASIKNLLITIKELKAENNGTFARIILTTVDQENIVFTCQYSQCLQGVIRVQQLDESNVNNELISQVNLLNHQLELAAVEQLTDKFILLDHIKNKSIKAMLQSQAESLTRKQASPALYKQFIRMYTWGCEEQILAKLFNQNTAFNMQDSCLQQQVISLLNNVSVEHKSQKNVVQFNDELPHLMNVQMANELFQLLCVSVAKLMLSRQRNTQLQLRCFLENKNEGQFLVNYQWRLFTEQGNTSIPQELSLLASEEQVINEEDNKTLMLLAKLLDKLHGQNININVIDKGYVFSFSLPHAALIKQPNAIEYSNLRQYKLLLISAIPVQQNIIKNYLAPTHIECIVVATISQAQKLITQDELSKQKIDLIVTCHEFTEHEHQQLNESLLLLPKENKPSVLQLLPVAPSAALMTYANHHQFAYPLDKLQFINSIEAAIKGVNKQAFPVNIEKSFIQTDIELLFAAQQISQYQGLIYQLQYCGFKITFTSSATDMISLWQSGRYLVLVTNFEKSPFVVFENGKQVKRAVLNLAEENSAWLKQAREHQWFVNRISPETSFEQLIQMVENWLVVKEKTKATMPVVINSLTDSISKKTTESVSLDDLPEAFNITGYAKNQASAELAAFMLDDYVTENIMLADKLQYALSVKSTIHIDEYLASLLHNANILVAEELVELCQQLQHRLNKKDYHQATRLMLPIKEQVVLINQYAEAI